MADNDDPDSRPREAEPLEPDAEAAPEAGVASQQPDTAAAEAAAEPQQSAQQPPQQPGQSAAAPAPAQPVPAAAAAPAPAAAPGHPAVPGAYPPGAYPAPGHPTYAAPAAPAAAAARRRPRNPLQIRPADLLHVAIDAVLPLAAGVIAAVLGLLLVIGAGLSGVSVQNAGAADYFAAASWLTAGSLGTPFAGTISESINLGAGGFGGGDLATATSITARLTIWLITVLILFLAFRAARARERKSGSRNLPQLVVKCLAPAVITSVVLLILALTTRQPSLFGSNSLFGDPSAIAGSAAEGVTVTQSGTLGIDAPLVFVGPLLLVLAAALAGRISVWIHAAANLGDAQAQRLRGQWTLWLPALRVTWLQTRIIVTLASVGLWFYIAVEAGTDSNSGDHPLVFVLGAIVLILNLGVYGMFAGFGVSLYATASSLGGAFSGGDGSGGSGFGGGSAPGLGGGSGSAPGLGTGSGAGAYSSSLSVAAGNSNGGGSYAIGIFNGDKPWEIWLLLAAAVLGTLAPAVLALLKRPRSRVVRREDYAPGGAWRSAVLGIATALALSLLGAAEADASFSIGSGSGGFGISASFGPSLLAAMGLAAVWFVLAYLALSYALGHRIQWSVLARGEEPAAGAPAGYYGQPGQGAQAYPGQPQAYQQPYPGVPAQPAVPGQAEPVESAVPVESVSVEPGGPGGQPAGAVEPLDPSETVRDVVFPDEGETLGEG